MNSAAPYAKKIIGYTALIETEKISNNYCKLQLICVTIIALIQMIWQEVICMIDESKAVMLRELMRLMERRLGVLEDGEMSCCGISMAQCHALVEIGRVGSISLVELSKLLDLDNSTMSRTVNNLVNGGMAERELDPNDRRYVTIKLTSDGKKSFEEIETNMNSYFEQIFNIIPEDKKDQVLESMQILLTAIGEIDCC